MKWKWYLNQFCSQYPKKNKSKAIHTLVAITRPYSLQYCLCLTFSKDGYKITIKDKYGLYSIRNSYALTIYLSTSWNIDLSSPSAIPLMQSKEHLLEAYNKCKLIRRTNLVFPNSFWKNLQILHKKSYSSMNFKTYVTLRSFLYCFCGKLTIKTL